VNFLTHAFVRHEYISSYDLKRRYSLHQWKYSDYWRLQCTDGRYSSYKHVNICLLTKEWHKAEISVTYVIWSILLHPNPSLWCYGPTRAMASSFLRFLDHTQRRTTFGRTPLDEWSARRRDLYLTTHNTHNRQTSIPGGIRTHDLSRLAAADLWQTARPLWPAPLQTSGQYTGWTQ